MIQDRNSGAQVRSTLNGDKVRMGISAAAMVTVMDTLRNQYSDQILACIREYSTNAWDAHVEAGTTHLPIEVTTPTNGLLGIPLLKIKDYGVGLSVDDIHEVYSQYGASTKRESNDFNGMLGIGCKAALSYTPQFTVTSVKNGTRVQVVVSLDEEGGSMTVVDTCSVADPEGTEVTIPCKRDDDFQSRALEFFKFWKPGTVLLNGKDPSGVKGTTIPIGTTMTVVKADSIHEDAKSYVLMGNVAYPIRMDHGMPRNYGLIAEVPMGSVVIHPSRERLIETEQLTQDTLAKVLDEFRVQSRVAIQKQIDASQTPADAVQTMVRWTQVLKSDGGGFIYKGRQLPQHIDVGESRLVHRRSSALSQSDRINRVFANIWAETVWFTGYGGEKFTANHKRKIEQWCANNGHTGAARYVLVDASVTLPADERYWIDDRFIANWADVKAEKLERDTSGYSSAWNAGRIRGSFDVVIDGTPTSEHPAASIDQNGTVYYVHGNLSQASYYAQLANKISPGCTVVAVPGNRLGKFQRDFPKAEEVQLAIRGAYKHWKAKLTKEQLLAFAIDDGNHSVLKSMDSSRVADPEMKRAIRLATMDLTALLKERKLYERMLRQRIELPTFVSPLTRYPLAGRDVYNTNNLTEEHRYIYINAVYAAKKNGATA